MIAVISVWIAFSVSVLACNPVANPDTGLWVAEEVAGSEDGSECFPFSSLTSAVEATEKAGGGVVKLKENNPSAFDFAGGTVTNGLVFLGGRNRLIFSQTMTISPSGNVTIQGWIEASEKLTMGSLFEVRGQLTVLESTFLNFSRGVSAIKGAVHISNSTVSHCSESFLIVSEIETDVSLFNVSFVLSTGLFLTSKSYIGRTPSSISIVECVLRTNTAPILISLFGSRSNSESALLSLVLDRCTIDDNHGSGILLLGTLLSVVVRDCKWTNNRGELITTSYIEGIISIANLTIEGQAGSGPLSVWNSGSASKCYVNLRNVSYSDSNWYHAGLTAGFFLMKNCIAAIQHVMISNVNIGGRFSLCNGFLHLQSSVAMIQSLHIRNSTSRQFGLYFLFSSITAVDLDIHEVGTGINILFAFSLGDLKLQDVLISSAIALFTSEALGIGKQRLATVVIVYSQVRVANVTIQSLRCINAFSIGFSPFVGDSLKFSEMDSLWPLVTTIASSATVTNMSVANSSVALVLGGESAGVYHYSNITVKSVKANYLSMCVVGAVCYLSNVAVENVTAISLIMALNAEVTLRYTEIVDSGFDYLVKGLTNATVWILNLALKDSDAALASLYKSQVRVTDAVLSSVTCNRDFYNSIQSNVSMLRVSANGLSISYSSMFRLVESSCIEVIDSKWTNLASLWGFNLLESSLIIERSEFDSFPFTLIQGKFANVMLVSSRFSRGGTTNKVVSYKGSLLQCIKCTTVTLIGINAVTLRSSLGGAIYIESGDITISSSSFTDCSATNGGAIQVVNSYIEVSDSNFTACAADQSGGAIDILSSYSESTISHSLFTLNRATNGGAINIRKDVPQLVNVRFERNQASYGPDIASYGVSVRLSQSFPLNQSYASGQTLTAPLLIDFLDHFNQVVGSDDSAELSILQSDSLQYRGESSFICHKGVFNLGKAPIFATPGFPATIQVLVTSKPYAISTLGTFKLSIRNCTMGEVYKADRCEVCFPGTYSFSVNDQNCSTCSTHQFCPGGYITKLDYGYWRPAWNASFLQRCFFEDKCKGGYDSLCEEGYNGKLCSECEEDWYRVGTLYCMQCSTISTVAQSLAFVLQYITVFALALYFSDQHQSEHKAAKLKIWIEHCQLSVPLLRLNTEVPILFLNVYRFVLYLGSFSVTGLPISCFSSYEKPVYQKVIISFLMPVLTLASYVLLGCFRCVALTRAKFVKLTVLCSYFLGSVLIESYTAIVTSFKIEDEHRWLFEDASIEIWSEIHSFKTVKIFSPLLGVYLLVPILAVLMTAMQRKFTSSLQKYDSFQCSGCKEQLLWVELTSHVLKCVFVFAITVLAARSQLFQLTIGFSVLIVLLSLLVLTELYKSGSLLLLSAGSKLVVFSGLCFWVRNALSSFYRVYCLHLPPKSDKPSHTESRHTTRKYR